MCDGRERDARLGGVCWCGLLTFALIVGHKSDVTKSQNSAVLTRCEPVGIHQWVRLSTSFGMGQKNFQKMNREETTLCQKKGALIVFLFSGGSWGQGPVPRQSTVFLSFGESANKPLCFKKRAPTLSWQKSTIQSRKWRIFGSLTLAASHEVNVVEKEG